MDDVIGIILLLVTIIVSLPIVGLMMFCGILWFADWRQERRFKKFQKGELSKEDWKDEEREEYKYWLGYGCRTCGSPSDPFGDICCC